MYEIPSQTLVEIVENNGRRYVYLLYSCPWYNLFSFFQPIPKLKLVLTLFVLQVFVLFFVCKCRSEVVLEFKYLFNCVFVSTKEIYNLFGIKVAIHN